MGRKLIEGELYFTQLPLLPTNPALDAMAYSPNEWRRRCWRLNPPECSECGFRYVRPESGSVKNSRFFCSDSCKQRWEMRLKVKFVPAELRNVQWPGREEGLVPEDLRWIQECWNKERDKGGAQAIEMC